VPTKENERFIDKTTPEYEAFLKLVNSQMKEGFTYVGVHEDAGDAVVEDGEGKTAGPISLPALAQIHEYGAEVKNGWGKGIQFTIPERSFLRGWVDSSTEAIFKFKQIRVGMILDGKLTVEQALGQLGEFAVSGIVKRMRAGLTPPLAASTLLMRRHGGSKPLIDSGQLAGSITHKEFFGERPE